jgi:hypothetical protein
MGRASGMKMIMIILLPFIYLYALIQVHYFFQALNYELFDRNVENVVFLVIVLVTFLIVRKIDQKFQISKNARTDVIRFGPFMVKCD